MTSDQWRRVRELFEQGLEQHPDRLTAWLEGEEPSPQIRAEVLSLLEHHAGAGRFLTVSAGAGMGDDGDDDETLAPGAQVGAYTIVRELGRGGMGRVYLATDGRLGRRVALKALPAHLAGDPSGRERLRREARVAASLTHPGICTVYALEELDGRLFIAAEYVEGRTLRDEIQTGRLPSSSDVAATAAALAAALASAHVQGVIHRDLKPENVMRAADGRLKILDFGLARLPAGDWRLATADGRLPTDMHLTVPGVLLGTPAYMAPEQLGGQSADARSDVFAFGVLVYEYASGVHPFDAQTPLAIAARVLESEATPIENLSPHIPATVASVIDRCLRKSPDDRWTSAVNLARALTRIAEAARRPPKRLVVWWRTHQLVLMATYVAVSAAAWELKELIHGLANPAFVVVGVASAVNGVLRGHLLFTEWMNPTAMAGERARAGPITLGVDVALGLALTLSGALAATVRPLWGMLTIAAAAAIVLARTILEPATTAAVFGLSREP